MDSGFAPTFKEAVGRWRRRHRHPPPGETWYAVHYRAGWLVERLAFLESVHLLRQGLDVRPLAAERPVRKGKGKDVAPAGKPSDSGSTTADDTAAVSADSSLVTGADGG